MSNDSSPRITFGMIVLNGLPFIKYNLKGLYPYSHQIIVVEGACRSASSIADKNGHSNDGTLEELEIFKSDYDPDDKIIIVTGEDEGKPNGFWDEKDEMSQAYAKRVIGDYIWQVDVDEFYKEDDIKKVLSILSYDNSITAVSFKQLAFFADFSYIMNSWYNRRYHPNHHRLFKWEKDYQYINHRPPTVIDSNGVNLRDINWLSSDQTQKLGVYVYHYSYLFPKQVREKTGYYSNAAWSKNTHNSTGNWYENIFVQMKDPFKVHIVDSYPSWLGRFDGVHPEQIQLLKQDIIKGLIKYDLRNNNDIEIILDSQLYKLKRFYLKNLDIIDYKIKYILIKLRRIVGKIYKMVSNC